jgi:hypothetical protein
MLLLGLVDGIVILVFESEAVAAKHNNKYSRKC